MKNNAFCYSNYSSTGGIVAYTIIMGLICAMFIGWVMNFQNLWEYWPATGGIMNVPMEWVVSLIGVFVAPLGAFTGYIW